MILAAITFQILIGGGSPLLCYTKQQWMIAGRDPRLWYAATTHYKTGTLLCIIDVCSSSKKRCKTLQVSGMFTNYIKIPSTEGASK